MYTLFATSEYLVAMHSTALYEGLGFCLKIFLLDCIVTPYMYNLIETGKVKVVSSADEIKRLIPEFKGKK